MRDLIYSNNVYTLRTELGISQDKMAADLEISRRSISKIENGDQNPSLEMVYLDKMSQYDFKVLTVLLVHRQEKEWHHDDHHSYGIGTIRRLISAT